MASWANGVRAVLLDICGVLYDSGGSAGGAAIPGSIEAVNSYVSGYRMPIRDRVPGKIQALEFLWCQKSPDYGNKAYQQLVKFFRPYYSDAMQLIRQAGLKLRFCTNESQATRAQFVGKLQKFGFNISEDEVTAPGPAARKLMLEQGLRPHLLVHDDLLPEFDSIDKSEPNCVVIGDAAENFSYQKVNRAFQVLLGLEKPVLISLGKGRYYKETDGLKLDVGAYMKALEYASDTTAEIVGKPSKNFFISALTELGVQPHEAIMVGDDVVNDIGGAQSCGIRGVLVRTGKYRPSDESHPQVTADGYVDNLAQGVDILLASRTTDQ